MIGLTAKHNACSDRASLCVVLQLFGVCRPDRAIFAATSYVANALGRKFVEPPVLDLGETLGDSTPLSPLIFVLSAGVDPTQILLKLALERSMSSKFFTVALGQGQVRPLAPHIFTWPVITPSTSVPYTSLSIKHMRRGKCRRNWIGRSDWQII